MKIGLVSGDWVHPERAGDNQSMWGGSGWVRIAQYMDYMPSFEFVVGTLMFDKTHFVIRTPDERFEYVPVVFMHRLMHRGLAENVLKARAYGQIVINDIDDWYWGLSPENAAFMATDPRYNPNEDRYSYRSILAASDLVIVSTPYLASRLDWIRCPKVVVKNTVDVSRFHDKVHERTVPNLGWVGSTAHRSGDLETVAGVLKPLWRNGEITLHHSGHHSSYATFASKIGVPDEAVSTLPLCSAQDYPNLLVPFDIGIVPLNVLPFNRSKSDIKGLEYASAKVPFVAQKINAYEELNDSLGIGRIAKNGKDWLRHIRALKDPVLRQEEAERNYEAVKARDITVGAKVMEDLINSLL